MDPGNEISARQAAAGVDLDPDFEPQSRPRCCTWPLPRPDLATQPPLPFEVEAGLGQKVPTEARSVPILLPSRLPEPAGGPQPGILGAVTGPRKGGSRRNAWGNQSYAELISQAIESAPEKRLTLAQIYEWMVRTVPYFKDKGDSNSSAGWKVTDPFPAAPPSSAPGPLATRLPFPGPSSRHPFPSDDPPSVVTQTNMDLGHRICHAHCPMLGDPR